MGIGPLAAVTGAPLVSAASLAAAAPTAAPAGAAGAPGFAAVLGRALQSLNSTQLGADAAAQQLAAGNGNDLATAVIAAEKANLSLQLAVEVRNRVVGGFQQLMQMQV